MGIAADKIEKFFGTKFEPLNPSPGEIQALFCFDGYAHWMVWFDRDKQWLYFFANKDVGPCAFPTLEVGVYCSGLHISTLTGGGDALILRPKGEHHNKNLFTITKTTEGRLSVCTTVGEIPSDELGEIPSGWFKDDDA